jgi:hypothetical protein
MYRPPMALKRYTFKISAAGYVPGGELGSIKLPANSIVLLVSSTYSGTWNYSTMHVELSDGTVINTNLYPPRNNKVYVNGGPATNAMDMLRIDKSHKRFYIKNTSSTNIENVTENVTVTLIVLTVI